MSANTSDLSLAPDMSTGLRSMFYLIPPSESSFRTPKEVPPYVDRASMAMFALICLEALTMAVLGRRKHMMRLNDAMSSLSSGIIMVLPFFLFENIETSSFTFVFEKFHIYELPYNSALTWVLCMLGVDLGYYWVHRFCHEVNFMWAAHQVHHSSEDYNLNTASRQSVFQKYCSWIFYLPMAFFIPPSQFAAHIQFNLLFQFWIHTNLIGKLGPLEWVLNTPSHHRVHHGRNRYCIDKNYAGVFIIWDRMFGTFVEEKDDDKIAFGLVHPLNSWDAIYTQLCHWKYMCETAWKMEGLGNKLSVFLKGPGWTPGKPRLGVIEDIPDIHAPQPRYNKDISGWMTLYSWSHFFLVIGLFEIASRSKEIWSQAFMLLVVMFMLWTIANIGYIYEHKWYVPVTELTRCLAYLAYDIHSCWGSGSLCPNSLLLPRGVFLCSAPFWLIKCANLPKTKKVD